MKTLEIAQFPTAAEGCGELFYATAGGMSWLGSAGRAAHRHAAFRVPHPPFRIQPHLPSRRVACAQVLAVWALRLGKDFNNFADLCAMEPSSSDVLRWRTHWPSDHGERSQRA